MHELEAEVRSVLIFYFQTEMLLIWVAERWSSVCLLLFSTEQAGTTFNLQENYIHIYMHLSSSQAICNLPGSTSAV